VFKPLARRTSKNAAIPGLIKVPRNVTTKSIADRETILLCQNKKPLNELGKTSAKGSRRQHRRANLCGKRWSISARGNMAPVPPSKLSPLDCPRHDALELNFRRRKEGRPGRRNRQPVIHEKQGRGASRRGHVPARSEKHSNANHAGPHRTEHYRVRRVPPHADARKRVVPELQKKPRAPANENAKSAYKLALCAPSSPTGRGSR
jgi:hypothetical protein